ncbi:MAG: MBL fold metallo-hydrolase [Planctomycetes bacterium]|nr:MBL fold metallo-hydrolase [Planctomycetota bacterium]
MRVRFWGVRGALATTEAGAQGVGGNTPCVEVRDERDNLVVLDAGIGLYWLGRSLLAGPHGRGKGAVTVLLSHTHWDHIQGFPFFVPAYIAGNQLSIWGGVTPHLEDILEGQLNPTYSPIVSLANMGATIRVNQLEEQEGDIVVGDLRIRHARLHNGSHDCVGYRLEEGGRSLCYMAEVQHEGGVLDPAAVELARGADILIHEAYFTDEELARGGREGLAGPSAPGSQGHSSYGQATELALAAGARRLYYFYHHPDRGDAEVEALVARQRARVAAAGAALELDAAREGTEVRI